MTIFIYEQMLNITATQPKEFIYGTAAVKRWNHVQPWAILRDYWRQKNLYHPQKKRCQESCQMVCLKSRTSVLILTIWVHSKCHSSKCGKCSALQVPGWCTHNGEKVECGSMDTFHTQLSPSWLRSGRGGANKRWKTFDNGGRIRDSETQM